MINARRKKSRALPLEALDQLRTLLDYYDVLRASKGSSKSPGCATIGSDAERLKLPNLANPATTADNGQDGEVLQASNPPKPANVSNGTDEQIRNLANLANLANPATFNNYGADEEIRSLRKTLNTDPSSLWWTDLAQAQLCVVAILPPDQVRAEIGRWRRQMHDVLGDSRYNDYLAGAPDPASSSVTDERLRYDMSECIRSVYYFYGAYGLSARSRSEVTKATFQTVAVILLILMTIGLILTLLVLPGKPLAALNSQYRQVIEWILATSALGTIGSLISVQRRLQDPTIDVDPFYRYIQTKSDRFGVSFVSPVFGAIFGFTIYGIVASNILSTGLIHFTDYVPNNEADKATLLIFSFLAGFAEQFVPDVLTRIATHALGTVGGDAPKPTATNAKGLAPGG